jgi:hypothetical protein
MLCKEKVFQDTIERDNDLALKEQKGRPSQPTLLKSLIDASAVVLLIPRNTRLHKRGVSVSM